MGDVFIGLDLSLSGAGIAMIDTSRQFSKADTIPRETALLEKITEVFEVRKVGYPLTQGATFEEIHRRIESINSAVIDMVVEHKPLAIGMENIVIAAESAYQAQLWGMNLLVQHTLFKLGARVILVPLDTWRSWLRVSWQSLKREFPNATPYQRSKILKGAIRDRVRDRWGVSFPADMHNEAEAYAIARYAQRIIEHPEVQQELSFGGKSGGKWKPGQRVRFAGKAIR
jgi:hypothetical protein